MRFWQLTWTEIRRVTSTRMGRITVAALTLVPTLYAGLYLFANHDPYGALDRVPAALVVQDTGVIGSDGATTNNGRDVADELLESADFGWHEVSRAAADRGVEQGTYDFALVIPASFTASLSSISGSTPEQAQLTLVTNDANSYLSTTIANTVVTKVQAAITEQVGQEAALQFLTGIADTRKGLLQGSQGAGKLREGLVTARDGSQQVSNGAGKLLTGAEQLSTGAGDLATGLGTLETATADLPTQTQQLATGAQKVADGDATLASYGTTARDLVGQIRTDYRNGRASLRQELVSAGLDAAAVSRVMSVYNELGVPVRAADDKAQELSGKLTTLATGAQTVADGAQSLAAATPDLSDGIATAADGASTLHTGAQTLHTGTETLATGATDLHGGLKKLTTGAKDLRDGLADGAAQVPATTQEARQRIAATIASPVKVTNASEATAGSYGEGLAPFFLTLAAWIGGYVLFLMIRPLSRRALAANQRSWRIAVGGWAAPALIGALQMVCAVGVVALGVGVLPAHVPAVLGVLVLASLTFIAVIHALVAAFGSPGQFLGLVLMVVQLVTAGGTFPWQTIPEVMHPLHEVLPMPHAVDAVRSVMYGGPTNVLWQHLAVLVLWLVGALVVTTWVAHRQRVWTPKRINPEFTM